MKVLLLAVGSLKRSAEGELCSDYQERLSRYGPFELQELKDAGRILDLLKRDDCVVLFDVKGAPVGSEELARRMERYQTSGKQRLVFVIGGDDGVPAPVKERADDVISFGPVTLPHRLFRVVALEQLYRAQTILKGEPYHRA